MRSFTEKDFYLQEFRARTLVLVAERAVLQRSTQRKRLATVIGDLLGSGSRVVIVVGGLSPRQRHDRAAIRSWLGLPAARTHRRRGGAAGGSHLRTDTLGWEGDGRGRSLAAVWQVLRRRALCVVLATGSGLEPACFIASRLRVHKLVILDRSGGLTSKGAAGASCKRAAGASCPSGQVVLSFLDEATLGGLLGAGEAEFQGLSDRRTLLRHIASVLESGVTSVNLCDVAGLERELFTYEGTGTLFTRGDYCRVERLSIDDFDEVERLLVRGQKEGLLKPRSAEEIGELLLDGYGAWIGTRHLAGVAALRSAAYQEERAGEITGLYAVTRFKGEGIGDRLVRRLTADAREQGLRFVFAVTTVDRASEFFRREGFREVDLDDVPAVKWQGYDPARRERAAVFRLDLT